MRRHSRLRILFLALVATCATALAAPAPAQAAPGGPGATTTPAAATENVGPVQLRFTGAGSGPLNIARRAAMEEALSKAAATGFNASQCRVTNGVDHEQAAGYWFSTRQLTCVGEPVVTATYLHLNRYFKPYKDHVSSVWHVPDGYNLEGSLGLLHTSPAPGTGPLYLCVVRGDNFVSRHVNCEGQEYVTRLGWIYDSPPPGVANVPVYRCLGNGTRELFESNDPNCEGHIVGGPHGYSLIG
ncbi:hypothetical protein ABZ714_16205 [Streptomyces sp. NPDC006798]|uniref:hypothetical protein n=1 Tax=Streptomyces sp. NPDC006798 TaxID=3155462 RepID=UPI0033E2420F